MGMKVGGSIFHPSLEFQEFSSSESGLEHESEVGYRGPAGYYFRSGATSRLEWTWRMDCFLNALSKDRGVTLVKRLNSRMKWDWS